MRRSIYILAALFSLVLLSCKKDKEYHELAEPVTLPQPKAVNNKVVAHRGGSLEAGLPDNSMAALEYSIELGLFAMEVDIYITKDNQVVVAHASSADKINGFYPWEATYGQLAAAKLSNGEQLPRLEDFLDRILEAGTTRLWLDVKSISAVPATEADAYSSRAAERAAEIIREKKAHNFVEFIVGKASVLRRTLTASKGDWNCAYMNTGISPTSFLNQGTTWANLSIDNIFYNNGTLSGDYSLEDYTALGIKVSVYNVDSEENRAWYAGRAASLYAICTNYPKAMLKALE